MPYQLPDESTEEMQQVASPQDNWSGLEHWGTRFGLARSEIRDLLNQRFPQGGSTHEARQFLAQEFDLEGYAQYKRTLVGADKQAAISPARWQSLPEHLRSRRTGQKHISKFTPDDYKRYDLESEGYTRRRNEQYAFQADALMHSSPIGMVQTGDTHAYLTTAKADKLLKRIQMYGAHEKVQLHGQGASAPQTAPLRSGPASKRPEQVQRIRSAMVVGGDPGPAGQFYLDKGITEATQRITKTIWGKTGKEFSWLARPGTEYAPGEGVQLAGGLNPINVGHKMGHRIKDVVPVSERHEGKMRHGYRFVMEQFAPTEQALVRSKAFMQKGVGTTRDLSRVTDAGGNPLNIGMLGGLKDVGGYVYSHFAARDINYLAKQLGMSPQELQGRSYAELGEAPLQAFREKILPQALQTIHVPEVMSKAQMERLPSEALAINPKTGKPFAPVQVGKDQYEVALQHQALVGDVGIQASQDFSVKEPRLSGDEVAALQRNDPALAKRITESPHSRRTQTAYRNIVNAALASTGQFEMPRNTLSAADPQVAKFASRMLGRAQSAAREAFPHLGANEPIPKEVLQQHFLKEWQKGGRFISIPTQQGNLILPPGKTLGRFHAGGAFEGEEVSKLTGRTYDVLSALASGNTEKLEAAAAKYKEIQMDIAGGAQGLLKAGSAFPGRGNMKGTTIRGAMSLAPHEVYVPGMAGQGVHMMRFPTQGGQEYGVTLRSLTEQEMLKRGFSKEHLGSMYAGMDVQQALAGDFDGDINYALKVGAIQTGQDGKLYAENGQQLTSPAEVKALARKAIKQGTGDLYGEMASMSPLTRGEALSQLSETLEKPHALSRHDFLQQLKTGQKRYEAIGPYFNTYRRGLATTPEFGREAMQSLFNISHGITQRPQELPKELQTLQDLMGVNLSTAGYRRKEEGTPAKLAAPTFTALRRELTRSLVTAKSDSGEHFLPDKEVAGLLGTEKTSDQISQAVANYRKEGTSRNLEKILDPLSTEQWLTGTGIGRLYGGQAARRLKEKEGFSVEDIGRIEAIGSDVAGELLEYGKSQERAVVARRKPTGLQGYEKKEASLIERANAAGGFLEMKEQPPEQSPASSRKSQRSKVGASGVLVGDTPPPAAAASPSFNGGPPTGNVGSVGGGMGIGGSANRRRPNEFLGDGGGGLRDNGGGGARDGGGGSNDRDSSFDWTQYNPPAITASKFGAVATLREHLDAYSGDIARLAKQGKGVSPKQDRQLHAVVKAAGNAPQIEQWVRQAHMIKKQGGYQAELAEQFLEMADPLMGVLNDDLKNAFEVGINSQVFPNEFENQIATRKRGLALGRSGQKLSHVHRMQSAKNMGRAMGLGDLDPDIASTAGTIEQQAFQYRLRHAEHARLAGAHHEAMQAGRYGQARSIEQQMAPLASEMKDLKNSITALKPEVKAHVDILKEERDVLKEHVSQRKEEFTQLQSRFNELNKQIRTEVGPKSEEKRILQQERRQVRGRLSEVQGELASYTEQLGSKQTQIETLTKQGLKALPGAASVQRAPVSPFKQAGDTLRKGYDPQRLFYQSQALMQGYYMLGQPLLRAREQYLSSQYSLGQAQYALGAGEMPRSVLENQVSQANMARVYEGLGAGVENSMTMKAVYGITNTLSKNKQHSGIAGSILTDTLALGGLAFGGKMAAGPLLSAGGTLAKGLGGALGVGGGTSAAGGSAAAGVGSAAALGLGSIAGGALAGIGVNELLAGKRFDIGDTLGTGLNKGLQMYGKAYQFMPGMTPVGQLLSYIGRKREEHGVGGQLGFESLSKWKDVALEKLGYGPGPSGSSGGAGGQDDAIPVYIKKIESAVAKELGLSAAPFDQSVTAQFAKAFAESGGISVEDLESGKGKFKDLVGMISESYRSGIGVDEFLKIYEAAPGAAGYAPGTEQGYKFQQWTGQGSMFERQQRLQALSSTQGVAGFMGMSPQEQQQLASQVLGMQQGGASQYQVQQMLSMRQMGNQFFWSQAAYASGHPEMAIMDEDKPWMSRHQDEIYAIQDRRKQEDTRRQLGQQMDVTVAPGITQTYWSGGQQAQQLQWQRQQIALGSASWNLNWQKQEEQFVLGQKQFDLNRRRTLYGLEYQQKQAEQADRSYEQQYAIQKQMFDLNTQWKQEDFAKQGARIETKWAWQQEDLATSQGRFEEQAAWAIEDIDEAIRFASGRDRRRLKKQRERMYQQQEWQRQDFGTQEERMTTQHGWAVDDLEEAKKRFEEIRPLQEELMELQKQQHEQNSELAKEYREKQREFTLEQLAISEEQNEIKVRYWEQERALSQQQHELEQEMQQTKLKWSEEDLKLARERAVEDEKILGWQRETAEASQKYSMYMTLGYAASLEALPVIEDMAKAAKEMADAVGEAQAGFGAIAKSSAGDTLDLGQIQPKALGGPTFSPTLAMLSEYGQEEHVVPQGGSLVLREPGVTEGIQETNALLVAILQAIIESSQNSGGELNLVGLVDQIVADKFDLAY